MSSDGKIEVHWGVEDGYVGKSRPQRFDMDLDNFDGCESDVEYEAVLDDYVQQEFFNHISWHCDNYTDVIEAAKLYNATEEE